MIRQRVHQRPDDFRAEDRDDRISDGAQSRNARGYPISQKTNSGARDSARLAVVADDPLDVVPSAALTSIAIPRSSGSCLRVPLREVWPPLAQALVRVEYNPDTICRIALDHQAMLKNAIDLLQISARSMRRILSVVRTIADRAGSIDILGPHVAETIRHRREQHAVAVR